MKKLSLIVLLLSITSISFGADKTVLCGIEVKTVGTASPGNRSIGAIVDDFRSEGARVEVCGLGQTQTIVVAVFSDGKSEALIFSK